MTTESTTAPARITPLWSVAELAAFLAVTEAEAIAFAEKEPGVPAPLTVCGAVRWPPEEWVRWSQRCATSSHSLAADRLWSIGDVATFLGMSENTTNKVINAELADTPPPVVEGRLRRWDPRAWWSWAEQRSVAADSVDQASAPKPRGRSTRV